VYAVGGEFVGGDVVAQLSCCRTLDQQVLDEIGKLTAGLSDMPGAMQQRDQFGAVRGGDGVLHQRVGLQHGGQPVPGCAGVVAEFGQAAEVTADLTFVPRGENRFDVGEVVAQRRPPDSLAIIGLTSEQPQTVHGAYRVMQPAAWSVLVPLAFALLLTGLLRSLGTRWGLARHYWVLSNS
jgi:hypothetical protein